MPQIVLRNTYQPSILSWETSDNIVNVTGGMVR